MASGKRWRCGGCRATSGFLLFLPRKDVIPLDMSVEEGVKLVISGGIVSPPKAAVGERRAVPEAETSEAKAERSEA